MAAVGNSADPQEQGGGAAARGPYLRQDEGRTYVGWRDPLLASWVREHIADAEQEVGTDALSLAIRKKDARDGLVDGVSEYHITCAGSWEMTLEGRPFDQCELLHDRARNLDLQRATCAHHDAKSK